MAFLCTDIEIRWTRTPPWEARGQKKEKEIVKTVKLP